MGLVKHQMYALKRTIWDSSIGSGLRAGTEVEVLDVNANHADRILVKVPSENDANYRVCLDALI